MPRKGHRKSRAGCVECKRRHIKCDEGRPVCEKCSLSARQCTYDVPIHLTRSAASGQDSENMIFSPASRSDATRSPPTLLPTSSASAIEMPSFDTLSVHIELFYNFEHETCKTVARTDAHVEIYRRIVISRAFALPHLMRAILGLSALHLSLKENHRAAAYRHHADLLQAQALETFDSENLQNVNESNVLDLLLFQHLTALHVFCDIFTSSYNEFGDLLERLVGCIRLLRGIQSVITSWWQVLARSDLGIIMQTSDDHQNSLHQSLGECNQLRAMLENADLSSHSIQVCQDSITRLQAYFDAENYLGQEPIESTNMLFAWLVTASPEFTDLLDRRRPEALVILAYFSVLLHRRRRSWAVADSGEKLLHYIKNYLGKNWEQQLAWPQAIVFGDQVTT